MKDNRRRIGLMAPIARGPPEWNELLYEPEWAAKARFKEKSLIPIFYFSIGIGIGSLITSVILKILHVPYVSLFLLVLGLTFMIIGIGFLLFCFKLMPFRIYKTGFTLTEVPISNGLQGKEVLIPFSLLKTVQIQKIVFFEEEYRILKLIYDKPLGKKGEVRLSEKDFEDPLTVMIALHEVTPDKLDTSLNYYIGNDSESQLISIPSKGKLVIHNYQYKIYLILSMAFLMPLIALLGFIMGSGHLFPIGFIILWVVGGGMATFMVLTCIFLVKELFHGMIGQHASIEMMNLVFPVSIAYQIISDVRPFLPVSEIVEARKSLAFDSYGYLAQVKTTAGETLALKYEVFSALERLPGFERQGVILYNHNSEKRSGIPIIRINPIKTISLIAVVALIEPLIIIAMYNILF